jgi:hypothetical protein
VQLRQRAALTQIALAHHLGEPLHPDALTDGAHPPAGLHRRQLARVADRDHLRPGLLRGGQQPLAGARRGHPRLVEHDHRALRQLILLEIHQRAIQRPRRHPGLLGRSRTARPVGATPTTR